MAISRTITRLCDRPSRGDFAYACARNQSQAHTMLVRAIRESGLSQKELASLTGIDEATISRALSRPRNIELNTLSRLVFGACGAFISFSIFQPTAGTQKAVYLANKLIDVKSSNAGPFFYRELPNISSSEQTILSVSSSRLQFSSPLPTSSGDTKMAEMVHA